MRNLYYFKLDLTEGSIDRTNWIFPHPNEKVARPGVELKTFGFNAQRSAEGAAWIDRFHSDNAMGYRSAEQTAGKRTPLNDGYVVIFKNG